ncbi:MAG: cysteine--tRNA ligase [Nitrospinota bacterium]
MSLRIYNTLTGNKEVFKPLKDGEAGMYVCGVTVYDRCHLGHARAGVVFDFVYRSLKYLGYKVNYVRNFTDVDDKIIKRAAERNIPPDVLVEENIKAFYEDMDALYISRPTHEPRATDYIDSMIKLISELIEKDHAYEAGGDVFFSVAGFPEYGKLSKKNVDDLIHGARVDVNEAKRDPFDFALWKGAKPGEPKWQSPWGEGRPGWHIECSAMGRDLLGTTFDIHGGGKDLVFPHHENEIAQSQAASGKPPVNYWMHNGFVNINKEKMSKSLGNFFTIKDVIAKFDPEAVRMYLLSTHYRSPIDFADPFLRDAEIHLKKLYSTAARAEEILGDGGEGGNVTDPLRVHFVSALDDDFNSAAALAEFNAIANQINSTCDKINQKGQRENLKNYYSYFMEMASVLGILNRKPAEYLEDTKAKRIESAGITAAQIEELIIKRKTARDNREFQEADRIRAELAEKGVELKDSASGTTWSVRAAG